MLMAASLTDALQVLAVFRYYQRSGKVRLRYTRKVFH